MVLIAMIADLAEWIGISVTPSVFVEYTTLNALAMHLAEAAGGEPVAAWPRA
jgi:hypothetical protein